LRWTTVHGDLRFVVELPERVEAFVCLAGIVEHHCEIVADESSPYFLALCADSAVRFAATASLTFCTAARASAMVCLTAVWIFRGRVLCAERAAALACFC
jgi:hypothetical protein